MLIILLQFLIINNLVDCRSLVKQLTDEDFEANLSTEDNSLVMFYAPWCTYCNHLKPQYEQAATQLQSQNIPAKLFKVDCTSNGKSTCKRLAITRYPTLKLFKASQVLKEYSGDMDSSAIKEYMTDEVMPTVHELTESKYQEMLASLPEAMVVGFFFAKSPLEETFIKVAEKLRGVIKFSWCNGCRTNKNAVVLHRPKYLENQFEPNEIIFEPMLQGDVPNQLESFILRNKHGLVGHRTSKNEGEFQNPLIVAYFDVDYKKNPKGTNYWRNRIMKVASNFSNDFSFAISAEYEFPHAFSEFGYSYDQPDNKPIILAKDRYGRKYKMPTEFSMDNFERFLFNLKEGRLKAYFRSGPIPNDEGKSLKTAVANNFHEVVTKNNKDVFLAFTSPWCSHCKQLEPVLEELAKIMASEDVEIVKMDATNNDIPPPYKVTGYPTIYWVPKEESILSPILYKGGKMLIDFIKFISQHSTHGLKTYDRSGNPSVYRDEF